MMAAPRPESQRPSPLPSRNPLPLSASQEAQVRELYYKNVRDKCGDEIRGLHPVVQMTSNVCVNTIQAFAKCATNRTISATWACRQQRLAMNGCMVQHATQRMQDEAREEWFTNMETRKKEREEREKQRIIAEEFNREWWKRDEEGK